MMWKEHLPLSLYGLMQHSVLVCCLNVLLLANIKRLLESDARLMFYKLFYKDSVDFIILTSNNLLTLI